MYGPQANAPCTTLRSLVSLSPDPHGCLYPQPAHLTCIPVHLCVYRHRTLVSKQCNISMLGMIMCVRHAPDWMGCRAERGTVGCRMMCPYGKPTSTPEATQGIPKPALCPKPPQQRSRISRVSVAMMNRLQVPL